MSWNIQKPGDYINGPLTVTGSLLVTGAGPHSIAGQIASTGSTAGFQMQPRDGSGANWLWYNPTGDEARLYNNIGNDVLIITNAGNTGIGAAPSSWRSTFRALDIGSRSAFVNNPDSVSTDIFHNLYVDSGGAAIHKALGAGSFLRFEGNVFKFLGATSASAGVTASLTTLLTLNGNAALVLSGGSVSANGVGIAFPSAQSASTDANTLDDYEEGTFTPTVVGSTTAGTATYSAGAQNGYYTKVGRVVTVQVYMVWSGHTGTGNMRFAGLPFTTANITANYASVGFGLVSNIALTANNVLTGHTELNNSFINALQTPVGGGSYTLVPLDTAGEVLFTCSYIAA